MGIVFHEKTKTFHLHNKEISYIIHILENGEIENLYFGKRLRDREEFRHHHEEMGRSHSAICLPEPSLLSRHFIRNEYPSYGSGDFRTPAYTVEQENGSRITDYRYKSHEITKGKPAILPLPSTYTEDDEEASTLSVTLHDEVTDTDMTLVYTIFEDYPAMTRHVNFVHHGESPVYLEKALSCSLDFLDMDYEMLHFSGAWGRERYVKKRKTEMGVQSVGSLAGTASGAEHNPFLILARPETTEDFGEAYGFSLVYSGNFIGEVEVSTHEMTRVMMGIHPEGFKWKLSKGESFTVPETVLVYSAEGFGRMSRTYHDLYRTRLIRGKWREKERPILLNNWEATYFDFNEEKILAIAKKAKEVGVELFVLDDGWFGNRDDDYRGLGDWFVNREKLPDGVTGLSEKVENLGLKFGIWVELEMINKDSKLYREHPDWVIGTPKRYECHSRHQFVLDMTREEVVDYLYSCMEDLLTSGRISYIKWDMNRYMTEAYGRELPADRQGEFMHRYILGVYKLYQRLTDRFPEVLFESCASGGARFDPAMFYFAPQAWCSDDTDANERTKIQHGTSFVYPLTCIGSHVAAVPSHQTMRSCSVSTRAAVAYFGTFGYELDLNLLSEEEIAAVKQQVSFMKRYRNLLQVKGDFYRILSPFEGNETGRAVVSKDKKEAIAMYFRRLNKVNGPWIRFKLKGLAEEKLYRISFEILGEDREYEAYGDELTRMGIPISGQDLDRLGGDFSAIIFILKEIG